MHWQKYRNVNFFSDIIMLMFNIIDKLYIVHVNLSKKHKLTNKKRFKILIISQHAETWLG